RSITNNGGHLLTRVWWGWLLMGGTSTDGRFIVWSCVSTAPCGGQESAWLGGLRWRHAIVLGGCTRLHRRRDSLFVEGLVVGGGCVAGPPRCCCCVGRVVLVWGCFLRTA